jgi:hypothetical protein
VATPVPVAPPEANLTRAYDSPPAPQTDFKVPELRPQAPTPQAELKMPELTPQEPAAQAAAQPMVDGAPSSPAALAFAARVTDTTPDKGGLPGTGNPPQVSPGLDTPAPVRIPMRYAATAQIIQKLEQKFEGDRDSRLGPVKPAGPALDRAARTDVLLPPPAAPARETPSRPASVPISDAGPTARTERIIEPAPAAPTSSRDIRVQLPDQNGGSTQVRFLEAGGEVRVSVRTADAGLAQNLRSHLNELTQRLTEGGVAAEVWKPAADASSSHQEQHHPEREGRGSGNPSGHAGGHAGNRGDQQDSQQDRPAWLEEMEALLDAGK